ALRNLAIVVEDEPSRQLLREMEIDPPDTLFGLYQGTPLTERTWDYGNALPDRILLFQGPHEREAEDDEDLVVSVGETLILEIGPGRGAITSHLTERAARVIAFEIDRDLAAALRQHAPPNLTIVEGDFLDLTPDRLSEHVARAGGTGTIRVAGNLPYNVASP